MPIPTRVTRLETSIATCSSVISKIMIQDGLDWIGLDWIVQHLLKFFVSVQSPLTKGASE